MSGFGLESVLLPLLSKEDVTLFFEYLIPPLVEFYVASVISTK